MKGLNTCTICNKLTTQLPRHMKSHKWSNESCAAVLALTGQHTKYSHKYSFQKNTWQSVYYTELLSRIQFPEKYLVKRVLYWTVTNTVFRKIPGKSCTILNCCHEYRWPSRVHSVAGGHASSCCCLPVALALVVDWHHIVLNMWTTLMGLNFAGIKFRGFRGFWPNPRKSAKFYPAKYLLHSHPRN